MLEPLLRFHYLGHSSFVLRFADGVSVLTDYGKSNAFGLESPIHDLGDLHPDVVLYSHHDEDHENDGDNQGLDHGPDRLPDEGRGVERDPVLHSIGEILLQLLHRRFDGVGHFDVQGNFDFVPIPSGGSAKSVQQHVLQRDLRQTSHEIIIRNVAGQIAIKLHQRQRFAGLELEA